MSGAPTRVVHHCRYSFLESYAPAISTSIARGVRTPPPFPSNIRKQWFQAFSLCPFPLSPHGKSLLFLVISRLPPPSLRRKVRTFADWAVLHSPLSEICHHLQTNKRSSIAGGGREVDQGFSWAGVGSCHWQGKTLMNGNVPSLYSSRKREGGLFFCSVHSACGVEL